MDRDDRADIEFVLMMLMVLVVARCVH